MKKKKMSQNEQASQKSNDNGAEVSNEDDENQENDNNNKEQEGEHAESNTNSNTNSRAPPKRAPASVKSHPSHSTRGAPSFESQMSPEQIETNLIKLFGNNFPDAAKDNIVLSDGLSVRDLRIIVRVLKLCGPSQVNVRKPLLCDFLMKHMQSERMTDAYKKYAEEKERARLARLKSREEKTKHTSEAQNQNAVSVTKEAPIPTTTTTVATTRSQARRSIIEKSNTNSNASTTDRRAPQQNQRSIQSSGREKQPVPLISGISSSNFSNIPQPGLNNLSSVTSSNINFSNHVPPPRIHTAAEIVVKNGGGNSNTNITTISSSVASVDVQMTKDQSTTYAKARVVKEITIPRLKYDSTFDMKNALNILKECNDFVLKVSDRLSELERAISIMAFKIAELEKIL